MWTSSSTTSGDSAAISATASSTPEASPAVSFHATDYRLTDAAAVGGHRRRVETGAAIADEHLELRVGRLGVDVHRPAVAAELRRVVHRLARGGDDRLAGLVEPQLADHD